MKYLTLLFTAAVLMTSCKSPYFTSANSMRNINGTVYLKNGSELTGPLSSSLESYSSRGYIEFAGKDNKKAQRIPVSEIKGVSVRNNYYEPKLIDMGFGSRDQVLLVKKLTKENSRINLYELHERRTSSSSYNNRRTYETDYYSYYVTLPGQSEEAWNIEGRHLTPNFENKMSDLVKDCPALAEKIRRKDKGYFYAQVSLVQEKRIETLMTIIDEYNKCK